MKIGLLLQSLALAACVVLMATTAAHSSCICAGFLAQQCMASCPNSCCGCGTFTSQCVNCPHEKSCYAQSGIFAGTVECR